MGSWRARVNHAVAPVFTQAAFPQPGSGFVSRSVEAGNLASMAAGRTGRRTSSPPQLGQRPPGRRVDAQSAQKVHSNEQIKASAASGGRSLSQHSQLGLSVSIFIAPPVRASLVEHYSVTPSSASSY